MDKFTKFLYGILFTLIIVDPLLLFFHDLSRLQAALLISTINFALLMLAYIVYYVHQRQIEETVNEKSAIESKLVINTEKLNDAFRYIGTVNRRLPLLQNITTELLQKKNGSTKSKNGVIEGLLTVAIRSIAKTEWGVFRFVKMDSKYTAREFILPKDVSQANINIKNSDLKEMSQLNNHINHFQDNTVIKTSDHDASIQCFLIFPRVENEDDFDATTLQAIVDQAQLFHKYIFTEK